MKTHNHRHPSYAQYASNCCMHDAKTKPSERNDCPVYSANRLPRSMLFYLLILIWILTPTGVAAQHVQIQMNLPPPGKLNLEDITEIISFNNTSPNTLHVAMMVTIEEGDRGVVLSGMSSFFSLPPGILVPDYTVFEPIEVEYADPLLENYVIQTNNMPGGDYVICIRLIDAEMGEEVGYNCIPHSVFHPSPPQLVYPPDGSNVYEPSPVFTWLPITPMPPVDVFYTIRLVEVFAGQLPYEAIQSNPSFFEGHEVMANIYPYPLDAALMEEGQLYAWQVQALMDDGFPVGENEGYSEVQVFQYSAAIVDQEMLTWISPQAGDEISEPNPLFEWYDPIFPDGLPPTGYYYAFKLTPLTTEALTDDMVVISLPLLFTNISEPGFIYPDHLPPLTPGDYSAEVYRISQEDYLSFSDVITVAAPFVTLSIYPDTVPATELPFDGIPLEFHTEDFLPPDAEITASTPAIQISVGVRPTCDKVLRELANRIDNIVAQIDAARQQCCDSRDRRDRLQAARAIARQQGRDLLAERVELNRQKEAEEDKIKQMENELRDLINSVIHSDVVGTTQDHGENYIGLGGNVVIYFSGSDTSMEIVQWFLREYRDHWQRLKDGISDSQREIERLERKNRRIDGDVTQLDRDIADLDNAINQLAAAINACNERVNNLLAERDALRDEMAEKHRECEELIRRYVEKQDSIARAEEQARAAGRAADVSRERTEPAGNARADSLQKKADNRFEAAEKALNEAKRLYESLDGMDNLAEISRVLEEIRKKLEEARKAAAEAAANATKAGAYIQCSPNGKREITGTTNPVFRIWDDSRKVEITNKVTGEKIVDPSTKDIIGTILGFVLDVLKFKLPFSKNLTTAELALVVHIPVNECKVTCVRSRICKNGRWETEYPKRTVQCRPIVIREFVVGLGEHEGGAAWSIKKHRDSYIHNPKLMDEYCK